MARMREARRGYPAGAVSLVLLTVLDQVTKYYAVRYLKGRAGISVIPGVFELFYLENRGAAFGMFENRQWVFIMIALAMLAAAVYVYLFLPGERHFHGIRFCMVLIGAGAVGNMIDRLARRYVVDFLYVSLIDFPVFNVADCYVVVGAALLILLIFTVYRNDSFACLDPRKE